MGLMEFFFALRQGGGATSGGSDTSLDFTDDRNSQYIGLIF